MENPNIPSRARSRFGTALRSARAQVGRLARAALYPITFLPASAFAQDILKDIRVKLADTLTVGGALILFAGFVAGAYIVISGAVRISQDREGGVTRFAIGVVVVVIMIAFTVYLMGEGTKQITEIRGS